MPHLVILYTSNLDQDGHVSELCRDLADTMLSVKDEEGKPVFPIGGARVLAYPSTHHAVSDGKADYGFVYLNLRMGAGRSDATKKKAGDLLSERVRAHFADLLQRRPLGITLQIDESPGQVYDSKLGNLHSHFSK
ncbi:MAG: 5-carboxymethyl-2-hydroxymuconate isomerase [Variovorax paradoxus]|nr:MAG: 5-carboxymethyl-2-hydroxymuconate isomerase [Variovorax paradoxus]PZQ01139.1 MAG: 5-carboxymethyl-2-hydroxymuconate isomerase [Variovorax paradoxus]